MARSPKSKTAPPPPPDPAGPSEAEAGGILTIDLAAIAANYRLLASKVMPAECAAVVKGDGYGCGLEPVTTALAGAGCRTFFVAHLSEAQRVRAIAPTATIFVLNGYTTGSGPSFAACNAMPVINSAVELAEWDHFVQAEGWNGGAALHVDTGMNRLGLAADETAAVAMRMQSERHGLTLLMSHLACADVPEHPLNGRQIKLFREIRSLFRGLPGSLANSSGIFLDPMAHCDLVRPGAALYGVNPTPGFPNPMKPVIDLKVRILQVRPVARGETVGYQGSWLARRDSRIAVLAMGYADGWARAAAATDGHPGREVLIGGQRCKLVGRVSMDLAAVDVTDLPAAAARRGEWATLIGGELDLDTVGSQAGTIGYEVLTSLGRRYRRVYAS